eukprot:Ihof_evm1s73 gene=Ihof_evmTU1s73
MFEWLTARPSQQELIAQSEERVLALGVKSPYKSHRVPVRENDYINTVTFEQPSGHDEGDLVIAHGFGAGLGFFLHNYDYLLNHSKLRVHGIDWLGMGGSSRPVFPHKPDAVDEVIDLFVESLEDWRREMKIEKMYLLGHSLGGYLSAIYSLRYPERVKKLLMVSPAGIAEADDRWAQIKAEQRMGVRMVMSMASRMWECNITPQSVVRTTGPIGHWLTGGYVARRFSNSLDEEGVAEFTEYLYRLSCGKGSGEYALNTILTVGAWARKPLIRRLHEIKMPTSFFYGSHDWMDMTAAE